MYMDAVVLASLITVAVIIIMMIFGFRYMFKHIRQDEESHRPLIKGDQHKS